MFKSCRGLRGYGVAVTRHPSKLKSPVRTRLPASVFKPKRGKSTVVSRSSTMDKDEVQDMIDLSIAEAMRKHNRNATLISACLGLIVLAFYSHGLIAIVEKLSQ